MFNNDLLDVTSQFHKFSMVAIGIIKTQEDGDEHHTRSLFSRDPNFSTSLLSEKINGTADSQS
jgi:hypothetical protein